MGRNTGEEPGHDPASLTPHAVVVTTETKDGVWVTQEFCHVAAKQPTPAGLVLLNQEGQVIALFTYDRLVSAVAKDLDKPKSGLVTVTSVIPFPGVH